jgi:hypothetical protein
MSLPIAVTGAVMVCDKGTAMVPLVASGSGNVQICDQFAAVVTDVMPGANISPFGICVITNAVCSPTPVGKWVNPFANNCIMGREQTLLQGATLPCAIGGTISVMSAAQASVLVGENLVKILPESILKDILSGKEVDLEAAYEALGFDPDEDSETGFKWRHPLSANEARKARDFALFWKRALYGKDETEESDAFEHALFSMSLTKRAGAHRARQAGDAHEISAKNPPGARLKDLFNNRVGRQLGEKFNGDEIEMPRAVQDAIARGELRIHDVKIK